MDLQSAYTVLKYAASPEIATAAERIIDFLWREIAGSYHAPTFQLAGPHSRSYGENMLEYAAGLKYFLFLALDGKYPLPDVETNHDWDCGVLTVIADLPASVRPEFREAPAAWREVCVEARANGTRRVFRQFRDGDLILGSVSDQFVWQQQRNVVAYWPVKTPTWHLGFCQDLSPQTFGNGYAHFYSVQLKGAVLAALTGKQPIPVKGGLRLGFNPGAQVQELTGAPPGSFVVHDGGVTAYIYPVTERDGGMTFQNGADMPAIERPWASADPAGNFQVLAYLLVFQIPGEAVPIVKDLSMRVTEKHATLSAEVNGTVLSLQVSK